MVQNNTVLTTAEHSSLVCYLTTKPPPIPTAQPPLSFGWHVVTSRMLTVLTGTVKLLLLYVPKNYIICTEFFFWQNHSMNTMGSGSRILNDRCMKTALQGTIWLCVPYSVSFLGSEDIINTCMKMTHRRTADRGFITFINKRVQP